GRGGSEHQDDDGVAYQTGPHRIGSLIVLLPLPFPPMNPRKPCPLRRNFVGRDLDLTSQDTVCCQTRRSDVRLQRLGEQMLIGLRLFYALGLMACFTAQALPAEYLEGTDRQKARAFSPAVITEGGRTVWLAGQTSLVDAEGRSLAGNFEGQAREIFR